MAIDEPHFMLERTENLIIRGERFRIAAAPVLPKRTENYDRNYDRRGKGELMSAKGTCEECGKERAIIAKKRCMSCYQKGRKKGNGEDKAPERPLEQVELRPRDLSVKVAAPEAQEVPVTIRLTLEINVRVLGVATA